MKEIPILFAGWKVRAILDGATQTRRPVKPQPNPRYMETIRLDKDYGWRIGNEAGGVFIKCPYGQPGDRLWVRETFQPLYAEGYHAGTVDWKTGEGYAVSYRATDGVKEFMDFTHDGDGELSTRCWPSIHMPRWASRLTLEVVSVRVERVQEITEEDARAEGVEPIVVATTQKDYNGESVEMLSHTAAFLNAWDSIYSKTYPWDSNPWVSVTEFRRLP